MTKIIDFWAEWCGPCKQMEPILDEIKNENDVEVEKVNVEEETDKANEYGIISIPTFFIYKDEELVKTFTGAVPKETLVSYL